MIIISVNQSIACTPDGKRPVCYFKRELTNHRDLSIPIENIVSVLHLLFSGVKHVINIEYIY